MSDRRRRSRLLPRGAGAGLMVFGFAVGTFAYWSLFGGFSVPDTDPDRVLDDPDLIFSEPWLVADAVEKRVQAAIAECMAQADMAYQAPSGIVEPEPEPADYRSLSELEDLTREQLDAYERALYGAPLRELDGPAVVEGCAVAGQEALEDSLDVLADSGLNYDSLTALDSGISFDDLADCIAGADLGDLLGGTPPDCESLVEAGERLQSRFADDFVTANPAHLERLFGEE